MKKILLVGNPNTGKTTLLNMLTKSDEHTGNWHGVTVEKKVKNFFQNGNKYSVVDLPGIYSLTALSFEEQLAIEYIFENKDAFILNVCDAFNLHRNLFLTLELLEYGANVTVLVNTMGDKKAKIDIDKIKKELGIEVFALNFNDKKEISKLKSKIIKKRYKINSRNDRNQNKIYDNQEKDIFKKIYNPKTYNYIKENAIRLDLSMFEMIKILEDDENFIKNFNLSNKQNFLKQKLINNSPYDLANFSKKFLTKLPYKIDFSTLAKEKFDYIKKFCDHEKDKKAYGEEFLDNILLNKFFAIPIFLSIMLLIFYLTFFSIGAFCSNLISFVVQEQIGSFIVTFFKSVCSVEWINGLIEFGFIGGVGSLVSFLPQIIFLFLFLAILEDTGYFSRIAFIFEDFLNKVGLSGKSVYTLLMGFGCAASAVLTARNMDNPKSKIKTAIITPYMSCSAKLPIYAVLGGAFFGLGNIFIIFLLYLISIFVALFVSVILDKFGLSVQENYFILEFPPYRLPKILRIIKIIWLNMKIFLIKITTIFISMNVIIWCLSNFSFDLSYVILSGKKSMLQTLGEVLAPIFAPLGFDGWGAVSALIAGFVAKEIVISSIAIFNSISVQSSELNSQVSTSIINSDSTVCFNAASAMSYMSFCLLYCPCLATVAILKREIGTRWTLIAVTIQMIVAYLIAFIVFNLYILTEIVGILNVVFIVVFAFILLFSFISVLEHFQKKKVCASCNFCSR